MSYLGGILLLTSVLALGQAAPVSSNAQQLYDFGGGPLYQQVLSELNKLAKERDLAKQESVDPGNLFRALGGIVDTFNQPRASEEFWTGYHYGEKEKATVENSFNYGDAARAIGGLIDAFGKQQLADQEAQAKEEQWMIG